MALEKALDIVKNTKSQEQLKAKNDVLQSVTNFTNNLQDKTKAETINQLAPKALDAMQKEWIDMKDIRDSKKSWENIMIKVLSYLAKKWLLNRYNSALTPGNKYYNKWVWKFKSLLKGANHVADKEKAAREKEKAVREKSIEVNKKVAILKQTTKEINETKEIRKSEIVKATTEAEKRLKTKFADKFKDDYSKLDEKNNETELKSIAEKELWLDYQTVKEKLKTSSYNGKLTIGQYFSFLKTQQVAKQNPDMRQDEDYKNFEKNFGNIQKEIPFVAKNNIEFPAETPVPAEDLQNLTAEQSEQIIENTEGMEEAVGTVEDVDYANPENIEMDDNDPVETKIYQATQQLANEPHHKLELAMIGRNDPNLNKDTALALHDIHEKIQEKGFFEDFPADDQDYFSQPPEQQKKMRKTLNPTQLKEFNALLKERNQIYSQMNTTAHLTAKDVTNAEKMIAKKGQEIAQKTAVGQFMKTVAGSLVNRVGDTNMWTAVKVHTDKMKLSPDGTRSTMVEYGGALLTMQIDKDGEVKMTDHINNDSALQKKLDWLDLQLSWFGEYVSESEKFVSDPENIAEALTESVETDNSVSDNSVWPFQNFQKNIKKSLFSHSRLIRVKISTKFITFV